MYKSLPGAKQIYAAVEAQIGILTLLFKLLIKILVDFQIPIAELNPPQIHQSEKLPWKR